MRLRWTRTVESAFLVDGTLNRLEAGANPAPVVSSTSLQTTGPCVFSNASVCMGSPSMLAWRGYRRRVPLYIHAVFLTWISTLSTRSHQLRFQQSNVGTAFAMGKMAWEGLGGHERAWDLCRRQVGGRWPQHGLSTYIPLRGECNVTIETKNIHRTQRWYPNNFFSSHTKK